MLLFIKGSAQSYDWILRLLFTVVTISAGYQGGEVTPLFAIRLHPGLCVLCFGLTVFSRGRYPDMPVSLAARRPAHQILIGGESLVMLRFVIAYFISPIAYQGVEHLFSGQKVAKK